MHNDDGVWLRLNDETVKKYVPNMNGYTEAWCLSFNQHLGRSLLVPADVSKQACSVVLDCAEGQRLPALPIWGKTLEITTPVELYRAKAIISLRGKRIPPRHTLGTSLPKCPL